MLFEKINFMQQALILADVGATEVAIAFNRVLAERYYVVLKEESDNALAEERLRQVWSDYLDGEIVPERLSDEEKEPLFAELAALTEDQKTVITRDVLRAANEELALPLVSLLPDR